MLRLNRVLFAALLCGMAGLATAEPTENYWFVTSVPELGMREVKQGLLDDFIAAEPGSVIHVVVCKPGSAGSDVVHKTVGTLIVPKGTDKARLRNRVNRQAWASIGAALGKLMRGTNDQLNVCAVGSTIAALRRSDYRTLVRLVGSPRYRSALHAGFNMTESLVPSDGSLSASGVSPFATNVVGWQGALVTWYAPQDWAVDHIHAGAVTRFYAHFFAKNDAELRRLGDRGECLLRTEPPQFNELPELEPDGVKMRSWRIGSRGVDAPTAQVNEVETGTATVSAVDIEQPEPVSVASLADDLLDEAELNPDQIAVRMDWISDDPRADIDFHVRTRGEQGELFWGQMKLPFGELYRDVRAANGTEGELDMEDLERVEAVRLDHDRLWHVELYLHTWQARAPVEVRIVVVWNGIRKETMVSMPALESNTIESPRTLANGWRRVPLMRRAPKDRRTASVTHTAKL